MLADLRGTSWPTKQLFVSSIDYLAIRKQSFKGFCPNITVYCKT